MDNGTLVSPNIGVANILIFMPRIVLVYLVYARTRMQNSNHLTLCISRDIGDNMMVYRTNYGLITRVVSLVVTPRFDGVF